MDGVETGESDGNISINEQETPCVHSACHSAETSV